jgi:glycosyltransferase involved in cell wall biosynthesis
MRIRILFLVIFTAFSMNLTAKVRIITFLCNHPELLEYQSKALKKFLLDDYELIVINDGVNDVEKKAIEDGCKKAGALNVNYEQSWHNTDPLNEIIKEKVRSELGNSYFRFPKNNGEPDIAKIAQNCSVRHCHLIQYGLDHYGYDHDDIVVIMDSDVLPIQEISIRSYLKKVPIVAVDSEFVIDSYPWVAFVAFDPKRLPNLRDLKFHVDLIHGVLSDSGSHSFQYLLDNPDVSYHLYPRRTGTDFKPYDTKTFARFGLEGLSNSTIKWPTPTIQWPSTIEFYFDYKLAHFTGGSGRIHPKVRFRNQAAFAERILGEAVPLIVEEYDYP